MLSPECSFQLHYSLGLYKSSSISSHRADKAAEHIAINFEAMVNDTMQGMHDAHKDDPSHPRFFPWVELSEVPPANKYNMDEYGTNGDRKQAKALFSNKTEVLVPFI